MPEIISGVAVTADIVGSRELADRAGAQREIDAAIRRVEQLAPAALRPLRPTVGDEQQGVYGALADALRSLLLLQLLLPEGVECRFGVGVGEIHDIPSASGTVSEGPAWWAARRAIDHVRTRERRQIPAARTWVVADAAAEAVEHARLPFVNAYLLARDTLVGAMSARARRLTFGRCLGTSQRDLADREGITQSAVSQALASAGAASVVAGYELLSP